MTTLTLTQDPPERLDLSPLIPERLAGLTEREIAAIPIGTSWMGLVVGDCFRVARHAPERVEIQGGSPRLDCVGARMTSGAIHVEGDVGQRLGETMRGGRVTVAGSAGPFAGTGARGGLIEIAGDAGDGAGGAPIGGIVGLSGASLVIRGQAGDRVGDRMRSGLIVASRLGDDAGCRMVAGTIVAERMGRHPGYGMKRGTLLARSCGELLPTFTRTGRHRLVTTRLLARALDPLAPELAVLARADLERWGGDLASLGKGELLRPAN